MASEVALEWLLFVLNTSVFVQAFVLKLPQIFNVWKSGTSGISLNSLLLECWA